MASMPFLAYAKHVLKELWKVTLLRIIPIEALLILTRNV